LGIAAAGLLRLSALPALNTLFSLKTATSLLLPELTALESCLLCLLVL